MSRFTSKSLVEDYIFEKDWRVKENSNSPKSFGGRIERDGANFIRLEICKNAEVQEK